MGRLTAKLVQTAYRVSNTRNEHGDFVYQAAATGLPCLFREISSINESGNQEGVTFDGQLWFDSDAVIERGDVYLVGTDYMRVEQVIVARSRLTDNSIQFIKCLVTRQRQLS